VVEVLRVLVEAVLVTVVVGKVLARRWFSTSVFLADRARPVLIVGAVFREGDRVSVCLTGVISPLPCCSLANSSSCTRLKI
jgi:hypothetical protein